MANVVMYSSGYCPFCARAKKLLENKGVQYTEIRVDEEPGKRDEMIEKSGRRTVPQIFINEKAIGGCDDLHALESSGQLDELLRE